VVHLSSGNGTYIYDQVAFHVGLFWFQESNQIQFLREAGLILHGRTQWHPWGVWCIPSMQLIHYQSSHISPLNNGVGPYQPMDEKTKE
jgi:hypothetical protein